MAEKEVSASSSRALSMPMRPTITLPPRVSMESLFTGGPGPSPGPMTLVSNFFSDVNDTDSECRSFSQLLAGAMASPAAFPAFRPSFPQRQHSVPQSSEDYSAIYNRDSGGGDFDFRFKQNRPSGFMISQPPTMFTVSPGLSPASLLDSPGFYLPGQVPFGMSHQQTLAQVTAHAQARGQFHVQAEYPSLSAAPSSQQAPYCTSSTTTQQHIQPSVPNNNNREEASEFPHSDQRSEPSSIPVDKITDDYNWRKYGQKQVKGSEYPRSYYKCTHPNCPVKKKVERSFDGQVTEIIYKGHHNHQSPKSNKRAKDVESSNGTLNLHGSSHLGPEGQIGKLGRSREGIPHALSLKNEEASQTQNEDLSGSSDGEEVGNAETVIDGKDEDEPESKKRSMVVGVPEPAPSHRTVTEPRIIVQTTSEVDLLDDGYRWRKYGQKVVKGNSYPRSYYKCTNPGCNVRKHVERAASDPKAVITTYEGKHNHDVPAPRNSSHNTANRTASQL